MSKEENEESSPKSPSTLIQTKPNIKLPKWDRFI